MHTAVAYLCTVGCKARKGVIESIIMSAYIRQRHKRPKPYKAITCFFDQKEYGVMILYTISRSSDPA